MRKRVGIPKSLLYYNYHSVFETFFKNLGVELVLSEPSHDVLEKGDSLIADEICLPVKNFLGHIIDLKEKKVDFIFIPRFVSINKDTTFCPKIIALPDLVKNTISDLPILLTPEINLKKGRLSLYKNIYQLGKVFDANIQTIYQVWKMSIKNFNVVEHRTPNTEHRINIALLGHSYNIYDSCLNLDLVQKIKEKGVNIWTPDMVSDTYIKEELRGLPKKIFWELSGKIVGSAKYFVKKSDIHGLINIVSFACGPDSLMGELIMSIMKEYPYKPYLSLVLDEHTAEAGIETRLEAFIEIVKNHNVKNNISTYGQY